MTHIYESLPFTRDEDLIMAESQFEIEEKI